MVSCCGIKRVVSEGFAQTYGGILMTTRTKYVMFLAAVVSLTV